MLHTWVGVLQSRARQDRARELSAYELASRAPRNPEWHDYGSPGKQRRWNGTRFIYRKKGGGGGRSGGGKKPAPEPDPEKIMIDPRDEVASYGELVAPGQTPNPKAGGKKQTAGQGPQVRPDGTGGPPGPNRKPTPEERKASARKKYEMEPPKRGREALDAMNEILMGSRFGGKERDDAVDRMARAFEDMAQTPDGVWVRGILGEGPVSKDKVADFFDQLDHERRSLEKELRDVRESYENSWLGIPARQRDDPEALRWHEERVRKERQRVGENSAYYKRLPLIEKLLKYM